jgi:hypothetical protein
MTENKKKALFLLYFIYSKIQQKLPFFKILDNRHLFFMEYFYLIQDQLVFKEVIKFQNFADLLEFRKSYIALPLKKVPLELTFLYLTGGSSLKENLSFTEMGYDIYDLQKQLDKKPTFSLLYLQNYNDMNESFNMLTLNNFFQKKKPTFNKNSIKYYFKIKKMIYYPKQFFLKKRFRQYFPKRKKMKISSYTIELRNLKKKIKVKKKNPFRASGRRIYKI